MSITAASLRAGLAPYALAIKAGLVLLVAASIFGTSWWMRGKVADSDIASLKAEHDKLVIAALEKKNSELLLVKARSNELEELLRGKANEQATREMEHRHAVAALSDDLVQLRRDAAAYSAAQRRRCLASASGTAGDSGGTQPGTSAGVVPDPRDVRDELFEEASAAVAELAPALQRSHERHEGLAAFYEKARAQLRRWGHAGRTLPAAP